VAAEIEWFEFLIFGMVAFFSELRYKVALVHGDHSQSDGLLPYAFCFIIGGKDTDLVDAVKFLISCKAPYEDNKELLADYEETVDDTVEAGGGGGGDGNSKRGNNANASRKGTTRKGAAAAMKVVKIVKERGVGGGINYQPKKQAKKKK